MTNAITKLQQAQPQQVAVSDLKEMSLNYLAQPQIYDVMWRLAEAMSRAGSMPKHLKNNPGDCFRVIEFANTPYWNLPAFAPLNATDTEPFGTSLSLLASTSFIVCVPLLPLITYLPKAVTLSGLDPTVNFIPNQPSKSLRNAPNVAPVTNAPGELLPFTVMLMGFDVVTAPASSVAWAVSV